MKDVTVMSEPLEVSEPLDAGCVDDTKAEPIGPLEEPEFEEVEL
jgi:hypothetical protein